LPRTTGHALLNVAIARPFAGLSGSAEGVLGAATGAPLEALADVGVAALGDPPAAGGVFEHPIANVAASATPLTCFVRDGLACLCRFVTRPS